MSAGAVKLRAVVAWMALMLIAVSLPLAQVWKEHAHLRFSRELAAAERERDRLGSEVLLLEAETRSLRQLARLEDLARRRLGLINPGPPIFIQPAGQQLAEAFPPGENGSAGSGNTLRAAFRKGLFR